MKNTKEKEHYIKLIYKMCEEEQPVTVSSLSHRLGVSKSSVSNMLKKLVQMGWVDTAPYQPIALTAQGKRMADKVVAKHRLIESFLVEIMGFESDAVHLIAEELEHVDAPLFFRRVKEMLSQHHKDPHGSAIPKIDF
ncbi:MAG: metal-dependent transcriptional regulator [Flavobacteriaceae bacterium]